MKTNIKKQFITSDWHLFHKGVLEFSNRPFKDVHHMNKVLVNNYNSTVPKDGICYFLGDIVYPQGCTREMLKNIISQLNGTKVLILGNHDVGVNAAYRMGFDAVMYGAMFWIANNQVTASHTPLKGLFREDTTGMKNWELYPNWHGETKPNMQRFIFPDWGQWHLHGHIHSSKYRNNVSKKVEGKQIDVGVDAWNFYPVSFAKIESIIGKMEQ